MTNKIKAIVVDDDPFIRKEMSQLLTQSFKNDIELLEVFDKPHDAIQFVKSHKPDLLFLDIQMPDMNGFEMMDQLGGENFEVIFITSFNEYAIRAIKYSALDYLLKPVDGIELRNALNRYRNRKEPNVSKTRLENLRHNMHVQNDAQLQLVIPTKQGDYQFSINDIVRCEADSNYTNIYLKGKRKFTASKTLSDIEEMLAGALFMRVHKSHLVNLEHVKRLTSEDELILSDESHIAISRRRLAEVKDAVRGRKNV
jgi:two-component system LytT family response regulator